MPNPPELSGPSLRRFNAVEAEAVAELLKRLNACWEKLALGNDRLPSEGYKSFHPAFLQYGGTLFDAYGKELLRISLSPDQYRDILTSSLITQIVFRIAPPPEHADSMGEWLNYVAHSWQVFDHALHRELSGGDLAYALREPSRWEGFIVSLNRELSRRIPDLMANKYARHSREKNSTPAISPKPSNSKTAAGGAIVERRKLLLGQYKAATGSPSHKSIYGAKNAGLHKPQFYEWRNGQLPDDSETTKNFERFLNERKPPIPRKPRA